MQKKHKQLVPASTGFCLMLLLMSQSAKAQSPVFSANFPASWNGTGTTVTDQSGAGNTGFKSGTATYTTAAVPPGALAGTGSMAVAGAGGIKVTPTSLLNNTSLFVNGGFTYNIDFKWDGTDSTAFGHTEKLIDYAGTESLQLITAAGGTATLQMTFDNAAGNEATAVSTTIAQNTWYNVTLDYDTSASLLNSDGSIDGNVALYVDGSLVALGGATKSNYGDTLNRPIGIGEFGYGHTTSIIGLHGDIYSAEVDLGSGTPVVPEPSTLALGLMGGIGLLGMLKLRRKA